MDEWEGGVPIAGTALWSRKRATRPKVISTAVYCCCERVTTALCRCWCGELRLTIRRVYIVHERAYSYIPLVLLSSRVNSRKYPVRARACLRDAPLIVCMWIKHTPRCRVAVEAFCEQKTNRDGVHSLSRTEPHAGPLMPWSTRTPVPCTYIHS